MFSQVKACPVSTGEPCVCLILRKRIFWLSVVGEHPFVVRLSRTDHIVSIGYQPSRALSTRELELVPSCMCIDPLTLS